MVSGIGTECSSEGQQFEPVITVSATYGAGGSVVAPRVAHDMGLPFIDRLISTDGTAEAASGAARSEEGLVSGEKEWVPSGRFLSYFARAAAVSAVVPPDPLIDEDEDIRGRLEQTLASVIEGASAVILGRAGAVLLESRPNSFHVRLDGPPERRLAWACGHEGVDADAARKRQGEADRARTAFVKRLYRRDPTDPSLYHLVIDSTALGVEATATVIEAAAGAFFERQPFFGRQPAADRQPAAERQPEGPG